MAVRPSFNPTNLYFITTTTVKRVHLFQRAVVKRIIADSLNYMRVQQWINLYAFVIMPNHIHFIVRFLGERTLSNLMRDFKKYTAKQIIRRYQTESNTESLKFLKQMASRISGRKHKVWEDGFDARDVFSRDFLRQKVDYIHNNPCQSHWKIVERPEAYPWSSARYYISGEAAIIAVDDVSVWLV
ncbi:MAG: transposase [Desulfobacterales bacterium]|nr:transposase [Desulfobacterales bacterium]